MSWLLLASIILSWILVAVALDQSLLAAQTSRQLLHYGAVNGALFHEGQWWRLLTSQFLHVHAPHMLFNAFAVLIAGAIVEKMLGVWGLAAVYFVGGCVGQFAGVAFYPSLVSSGASQALMALCGAALLLCRTRADYLLVIPIVAVQLVLDIAAAGTIKAGHGWGLVGGLLVGALAMLLSRPELTARH